MRPGCQHCGSPDHKKESCVDWRVCEEVIAVAWEEDPSGTAGVYAAWPDGGYDMHAIAQVLRRRNEQRGLPA